MIAQLHRVSRQLVDSHSASHTFHTIPQCSTRLRIHPRTSITILRLHHRPRTFTTTRLHRRHHSFTTTRLHKSSTHRRHLRNRSPLVSPSSSSLSSQRVSSPGLSSTAVTPARCPRLASPPPSPPPSPHRGPPPSPLPSPLPSPRRSPPPNLRTPTGAASHRVQRLRRALPFHGELSIVLKTENFLKRFSLTNYST